MDLSPFFNQIFSTIFYLLPLAIIVLVVQSAWFKGKTGEFVVNLSTNLMLDKEQYHLIKNVTLPTLDGSTQIDHIVVSIFGVFVVETKNMKGWIFGSESQAMWTQQIYKHKNKFQNPLRQNYKHVETLKSLLNLKPHQLYSVIVFVGDSTFKTSMPENVTYGGGYLRFIQSKKERVLSEGEVSQIIKVVEQGRLTDSIRTNREHVAHVKSLIANKESINSPKCPKCGSATEKREAKKGKNTGKQFWGCVNFPRCKGTVNISPTTSKSD